MRAMQIAGRPVGPGAPTYVIAELSANHRNSYESAVRLVEEAARAGVDAVKLQTYTADTITIDSQRPEFRIGSGTVWDGRTLHDLYAEAATPWEWHEPLRRVAAEHGLELFSSPFDRTAIDFLSSLGVPAFKIASFEIVDVGLIAQVAHTGKPMIISTGMATLDEIEEAVATARDAGARDIALLKCTSAYPAPPEEADLRTIPDMAARFGVPVGLSDHTLGTTVAVAAVAVGAAIVEKHLTLSRADGGPDGSFSLEPHELREMVGAIRTAEQALGSVSYEPSAHEAGSRSLRRSLFVVADIGAGEAFTEANVRSIRPGHGLHTRHLSEVLGRTASRDIERGTPLSWELVAPVD
jgi:pseudaminic acid synthase